MKAKSILYPALLMVVTLFFSSCGKEEQDVATVEPGNLMNYTGEKAVAIREQTVIELLAIKKEVKETVDSYRNAESLDTFVSDLESFRSRLEYLRMQTERLPKKEQMVIQGNLAVATNLLEKDLLAMLAKAPDNDDLAVEIANLREKLSPILPDSGAGTF